MRILPVLLVTAAAVFGGCLDSISDRFGSADPPAIPGPVVRSGAIVPNLDKTESFQVPAGVATIALTYEIAMAGSPAPLPALAQIEFTLRDPNDAAGETVTLTPQTTKGTARVTSPMQGSWLVHVKGMGLSNGEQGATYTVTVTFSG